MSAAAARSDAAREQAIARLRHAVKATLAAARRLRGRDTHRPGELSLAQFQLLFALQERGEMTTGELAHAAELAPASVTQMLDSLTERGLALRSRSTSDRRVVTCTLTSEGRRLVRLRAAEFEARLQAQLEAFDAAEIETAAAVLERLSALYDDDGPGTRG